MFLFDMCEECGIAEVGLPARAFVVPIFWTSGAAHPEFLGGEFFLMEFVVHDYNEKIIANQNII